MDKEFSFKISSQKIYMLIFVLIGFILSVFWSDLRSLFISPRIVSVDLIQIIRVGQGRYKTKPEIESFTKQMNYILTKYADNQNVIIVSKQVVIKGADDVTNEVSKQIFRVK